MLPARTSSCFRPKGRFQNPTRQIHDPWQTDFTYFKVIGRGWYYLLTILDDYSRFILAWKLYTTKQTSGVTAVNRIAVRHRRRLLSDNSRAYAPRNSLRISLSTV
ncbi:MAG TPA: transposase family protein [Gammaproteobacteria bacterium]|nr:transposase family protein [Gammaproteobacteria bacterium]